MAKYKPTGGRPGRPSPYRPTMVNQVAALARLGAIQSDVAEALGVDERTIKRWRHQYPDFDLAFAIGADAADRRVEASLYQQATGYWVEETETRGKIVVKRRRWVEPSTSAAIFWMKARKGWRDSGDPLPPDKPAIDGELSHETPRQIARRALYLIHQADKEGAA